MLCLLPILTWLVQIMLLVSVMYTTQKQIVTRLYCLLVFSSSQQCLPNATLSAQSTQLPLATVMSWNSSDSALAAGLGHTLPVYISEGLFLSKSFSHSMRPCKIIPFLYRASGTIKPEDVTVSTIITNNRFQVFARLVERYQGPISVTVHVRNSTSHIIELLSSLHTLYTSSPTMSTFVDVHLVIDSFDRQFNTWRNIARLFARSDFTMMLDVDFALCTDFRSALMKSAMVKSRLTGSDIGLVIPAFEYSNQTDGTDPSLFPSSKESLLSLIKSNRISMFHAPWPAGHNSTDYNRFYKSSPGTIYKVTKYQSAYEPYIIFRRSGPPWCDERFVGYGGNKAACLFEMYLSGMSFYVLADHFVIHQNHAYEEVARKNERKYNKKVYTEFKWETCLRYFRKHHQLEMLNTTHGYNVQEECLKYAGMAKTVAQVLQIRA